MPDQIQPGTQGQPSADGTQNNPPGSQQQAPQEPAYFQHIPEQYREEAKQHYLRQSDYTKKTQDFSEKEKAWQAKEADYEQKVKQYNDFAQQYQPFYQKLQQNWDRIAPILAGQQLPVQQQTQNGNQPHQDQWGENFDVLPPAEQAKRIAEYTKTEYLSKELQAMRQEFNAALSEREKYYQNFLNIYTDAFTRKFQNPGLDMQAFMKKAIDIQYGRENPMDLAYTATTSEADRKALEEQYYKKGREDRELEYTNQQQTNGALQNQTIPNFRQTPLTREQVTEAARQVAVKKGLPW
jgi:hypothetical protein